MSKKGQTMRDILDSTIGYVVGLGATFSVFLWEYSSTITTLGGLVVLGCRLYVDGGRALDKWRDRRGK